MPSITDLEAMIPEDLQDLVEPVLQDLRDLEDIARELPEEDPDRIRERDVTNLDPNDPVAVFGSACVVCQGDCTSVRLTSRIGVCERCVPVPTDRLEEALEQARREHGYVGESVLLALLVARFKPRSLERYFHDHTEPDLLTNALERLFERATGFPFYPAQRVWTRRLVMGRSFSILAPTGMGKTTWASLVSAAWGHAGRKVYYVVPTTTLVRQVTERITEIARKTDLNVRVQPYHSAMTPKQRREALENVRNGDFDVLITTAQFMVHHLEDITHNRFDLIIVDDVDSIIRGTGRNVERLLTIAGLRDDEIEAARRLANLRRRYYSLRDWLSTLERRNDERAERVRRDLEELREEMERLQDKLERAKEREDLAQLVMMSATGATAPTRKLAMIREVFDFDVGAGGEGLRNIQDVAVPADPTDPRNTLRIVRRLGTKGGLVFIPQNPPTDRKPVEIAEETAQTLRKAGIRAEAIHSKVPPKKREEIIDAFSQGDIDVLVAVASPYGVVVRGLDLPHAARYALFLGTPRQRIRLTPTPEELNDPRYVATALSTIARLLDDRERRNRVEAAANRLWNVLNRGPWIADRIKEATPDDPEETARLADADPDEIARRLDVDEWTARNVRTYAQALATLLELLGDTERIERLARQAKTVALRTRGDDTYIEVPDMRTYVQASGRVSRLFAGGITFGISTVLVDTDDEAELRLLNGLITRMYHAYGIERPWRSYPEPIEDRNLGLELEPLTDEELDRLIQRIDEDRERVLKIMKGELEPEETEELARSALMIVESPNKARMIASLFARRPSRRVLPGAIAYETTAEGLQLTVVATQGHVADLKEEPGTYGVTRIADRWIPHYDVLSRCPECGEQLVGHHETCPNCGAKPESKLPLIQAIRELATEADVILIGTDPDTEGEKIGWDAYNYLGRTSAEVHRTEFHEVTRTALTQALKPENWREIDRGRVSAQILRRIADRWIGFALSQDLWDVFKRLDIELPGTWKPGTTVEITIRTPKDVEILELRRLYDENAKVRSRPLKLRPTPHGHRAVTRITRGGKLAFRATLKDPNRALGDRHRTNPNAIQIQVKVNGEPIEPKTQLEPMTWLSAGRVQTPVLGWVIERTDEYKRTTYHAARVQTNADTLTIETLTPPPNIEPILEKIATQGPNATFTPEELGELKDSPLFQPQDDGTYTLSEHAKRLLQEEGLIGLLLALTQEG